jgi:PilZ domain
MVEGRPNRSPRVSTSLAAVLVDSDGGELPVEVTDLSSGGFRLCAGEPLVVGERVRLRVARYGDFPAQIQWIEGNDAGGRFLTPITLNEGDDP